MGDASFPLAEVGVHAVVQRFYELRQQYTNRKDWPFHTKRAQGEAAKFIEWCRERDVDPMLYMEARFKDVTRLSNERWPSLARMHSPKFLERWEKEAGNLIRDQHHSSMKPVRKTPAEQQITRFMQKPTVVEENLRGEYLREGRYRLCMHESENTGGYDPRSKHCPNCPIKHECLLALNREAGFDVGALRVRYFARLPPVIVEIARAVNGS